MEQKLAAYRRRKRREAMLEALFSRPILPWSKSGATTATAADEESECLIHTQIEEVKEPEQLEEVEILGEDDADVEEEKTDTKSLTVKYITYVVYFLLYTTLYLIAIQLEFGAVYFIISSFILIWLNTRTRPKKQGEVSAYSVFNPNCEAIDGTLNAEQFEREIRFGSMSVR